MRAKFIGDPRNGGEGPKTTTTLGKTFRRDAWTSIDDEKVFRKLEGNTHFETSRAANDDADEVVVQPAAPGDPVEGDDAERIAILAELDKLGADKPHHKTGLPRLRELVTAARAKAEEEAFFNGED